MNLADEARPEDVEVISMILTDKRRFYAALSKVLEDRQLSVSTDSQLRAHGWVRETTITFLEGGP